MKRYDDTNIESILNYAQKLKNKSLNQITHIDKSKIKSGGKGSFGNYIEELYFEYNRNSDSDPDFKKVGYELKTSPLKLLKNKRFVSKERLVLSIINYMNVINEDFTNSKFWSKNAKIIFIFYLYEKEKLPLDYIIKIVEKWEFPKEDIIIIEKDFNIIKNKVLNGKAHELSESDTLYLGACTKGSSSKSVRTQPNSAIPAKQRAFSLKQGYLNHIINKISGEENYGKIIDSPSEIKELSLEELILNKFDKYLNKNIDELKKEFNYFSTKKPKNLFSIISHLILSNSTLEIEEIEKSEMKIKTVRIEEKNSIEQHLSLPTIDFYEIYNNYWENSELKKEIDRKFIFVFFKKNNDDYHLEKVVIHQFKIDDINEIRKVWLKTKKTLIHGNIFKKYAFSKNGNLILNKRGEKIKLNNFPKSSESNICHVRPDGKDSYDCKPIPIEDKILRINEYSKQSFWINKEYILNNIYKK